MKVYKITYNLNNKDVVVYLRDSFKGVVVNDKVLKELLCSALESQGINVNSLYIKSYSKCDDCQIYGINVIECGEVDNDRN